MVVTLAPGLILLVQKNTNKLITYDSNTSTIKLNALNPANQYILPEVDGKDLMLFKKGMGSSNCLFKYNTATISMQAINSVSNVC